MLLGGCGGDGYEHAAVHGTVSIDGQPVPKGSITFTPTEQGQGPGVGAEIVDGKYRCEKVALGKVRVTFIAQAAEVTTVRDMVSGTDREVPKNILPPGFTGLDYEVQPGEQEKNFELTGPS